MTANRYRMVVEPLAPEDGGGFLAYAPGLPGCMSDGETPEEAITNLADAVDEWLAQSAAMGRVAPTPSYEQPFVLPQQAVVAA